MPCKATTAIDNTISEPKQSMYLKDPPRAQIAELQAALDKAETNEMSKKKIAWDADYAHRQAGDHLCGN